MTSNPTQYDVIIIGGGASGLMCAAVLNNEQPSLKVLVIDSNEKPGRKLLATGNGRCNFTNLNLSSECYNTDDPVKLSSILTRFPSQAVIDYFEDKLGVIASYKGDLVYPITYQSKTVNDALVHACKNTEFIYGTKVTSVVKSGINYEVNGVYSAFAVVFACGGVSLPDSGSDGSLYPIIMSYAGSDSFAPLLPSLVALKSSDKDIKKLSGLRQECTLNMDGHIEKGELLFTDYGISGICVMQLSGFYNRSLASGRKIPFVSVDLIPSMSNSEKLTKVKELMNRFPDRNPADAISGLLKKPLAQCVCARTNGTAEDIARIISDFKINLSGSQGFTNAQITSGGLKLNKVTDDLELINVHGIYVIGEALNVDGLCGGYNLHWAWASAMTAARSIADELEVL